MQPGKFKEQEREEFNLFGPPHPGEVFRDDIFPRLKLSRKALASQMHISYGALSRFITGRKRVLPSLAMELSRISGTSVLYWLVLQAHHDAWRVETRAHVRREAPSKRKRSAERLEPLEAC